jgi:hypothetical protein
MTSQSPGPQTVVPVVIALVKILRTRSTVVPPSGGTRLLLGLLALLVICLPVSASLAARSSATPRKPSCYAKVAIDGHSLRFAASPAGAGTTVALAARRYTRPLSVAQTPACSAFVVSGRSYRASLRYRSTTSSLKLAILAHSKSGWRLFYEASRLARASKTRPVSVSLRPIPSGVDRVSIGLTLVGRGSVQAEGLALSAVPAETPAQRPETPSAQASPAPGGSEVPAPGSWQVMETPVRARSVHAILLQNGKVLVMAGSGNNREAFLKGEFKSYLYDPLTDEWKSLVTPNDVFCSGHVQLANGNVLIIGGTSGYPPPPEPGSPPSTKYKGENSSWIFNIATDEYETVKSTVEKEHEAAKLGEPGPLLAGAWYPSATELGNGDVISFGGLDGHGEGSTKTNYYTGPGNTGRDGDGTEEWVGFGSTKVQQTYPWFWGLYPSMILTADGRLFYDGSHVFGKGIEGTEQAPSGSSLYDFYCSPGEESNRPNPAAVMKLQDGRLVTRVTDTPGLRYPDQRDQSASLLLPPAQEQKVMIMGGGETAATRQYATASTDEIKLDEANPRWIPGPDLPRGTMEEGGAMEPMGAGRMYVSAVALPNGMVLETGGSLIPRTENVLETSIFNPKTNSFTSVAHDPVGRDYHSEALLLPDGRVMALGSNPANSNGEESFETRISIYTPSYLTQGVRPVLGLIDGQASQVEGSVNRTTQWEYGTEHALSYSSPRSITSAVLMRPAAVTHSSDPNQREVNLPITSDQGGQLSVGLPPNPNLTPPGYYMVFLVDSQGVPSIAKWVHVGAPGKPGS